jgi:hypothetical protein
MRRKIGPPVGIQTLAQLRQANHHLDRVRREVDRILTAMRKGAALHLHYENGRPIWRLTSGPFVTPQAAALVISSDEVVGVGDSLFPGHPGQTWRYSDV